MNKSINHFSLICFTCFKPNHIWILYVIVETNQRNNRFFSSIKYLLKQVLHSSQNHHFVRGNLTQCTRNLLRSACYYNSYIVEAEWRKQKLWCWLGNHWQSPSFQPHHEILQTLPQRKILYYVLPLSSNIEWQKWIFRHL